MAENLGAKFTIDVSQLRAGLAQANRLIRESESEFKAASAGMGDWQKNADGLRARINQLNSTAQIQREKVRALQEEYNRLIAEGMDPTSAKAIKMRTDINNATAAVGKSEAEAARCTKALDELGNEAEDSGKKAKASEGGWSSWGQTLADLRTKAIEAAISGIKELGAAVVNVGKQALDGYADFEQLEGGVKKLFGDDAAKTVAKNASNAFTSAGMSANEYMETVTGFSASLISGLNGDTAKAAQIADTAIRDMSDNANTFGTDISSIQYAYQGFAKQNYTMLDNLKLGYGGTKEEMARLVRDSGILGAAGKDLTAKNLDQKVSYDQIILAINKTQERMGIMGTTAKEAGATIQGSTAAMKSAWQNMMTGMADENADIGQLSENFVTSLITAAENIVPRVTQIIQGLSKTLTTMLPQLINKLVPLIQQNLPLIIDAIQQAIQAILDVLPQVVEGIVPLIPQIVQMIITLLPQIIDAGIKILLALIQGITQAIPQLIAMLPGIITQVVNVLIQNLPAIITAGVQLLIALIQGIVEAIPQLIEMLPQIIDTIVTTLIDNLPALVDAGIELLVALILGLVEALPQLVAMVPTIVFKIVETLANNMPQIVMAGAQIIVKLISGIFSMIGQLIGKIGEVGGKIINKFKELPGKIIEVGKNLVKGLWEGINNAKDWVLDKIKGFGESVLDGIKSFFGIKSPSRVMRDQVGVNLAKGIGVGFEEEIPEVQRQIQNSIDDLSAGGFSADINGSGDAQSAGKSVTINQTNNYAAAHTRYELYKSKQDTAAAVKFALMGV